MSNPKMKLVRKDYDQPFLLHIVRAVELVGETPLFTVGYQLKASEQQIRDFNRYGQPALSALLDRWKQHTGALFRERNEMGVLQVTFHNARDARQFEDELKAACKSDNDYLQLALDFDNPLVETFKVSDL